MAGYVASRIGRLNANVAAYNYELKEDSNGLALFFAWGCEIFLTRIIGASVR